MVDNNLEFEVPSGQHGRLVSGHKGESIGGGLGLQLVLVHILVCPST